MSRSELAEAVNAWLYETTGSIYDLDRHLVAKWERGAVRWPKAHYRAALRAICGVPSDAELGFSPPERNAVPLNAKGVDAAEVMTPDDADRVSHAVGKPSAVDPATLTTLADVLAGLRRLEDRTSASDVLPSVLQQQELISRLTRGTKVSLRPAAVGLASEIAQYLGWLAIPRKQWEQSRRHLDRAVVLAMEAEDPTRLATALSFSAYRALRVGDLSTANCLSVAAGQDTRIDPGLRTYVTYQLAEVLAQQGDHKGAVQVLGKADRLVEHLPRPEELPPSGYWYIPAFFLGQRGFVLRALGDLPQARRAAAACLEALPEKWRHSEWAARRRALAEQ